MLEAENDDEAVSPDATPPAALTTEENKPRPWSRSVAFAFVVGLCGAAIGYFAIALPTYFVASLERNGRDRAIVRNALTVLGPTLALIAFFVVGGVALWWHRKGERWTAPPSNWSNRV